MDDYQMASLRLDCLRAADKHSNQIEMAEAFFDFVMGKSQSNQPPQTDEYVAEGSSLFSKPKKNKAYTPRNISLLQDTLQEETQPSSVEELPAIEISPESERILNETAHLVTGDEA